MEIQYKNDKVFERSVMWGWHAKLILVVKWLHIPLNKGMVMTSSWRPFKIHANDSGIAQITPLRHTDWRSRNYPDPKGIEHFINHRWMYDPDRPHLNVCVYHNTGFGHHFHIQVHDKTTLRGGNHGN